MVIFETTLTIDNFQGGTFNESIPWPYALSDIPARFRMRLFNGCANPISATLASAVSVGGVAAVITGDGVSITITDLGNGVSLSQSVPVEGQQGNPILPGETLELSISGIAFVSGAGTVSVVVEIFPA